jgi:pyruvate carboxylase
VASSARAALAGADIVDGCIDSLAGGTSQPSLRAIAATLRGSDREPDLDLDALQPLHEYWAVVRGFYGFLESGPVAPDAGVFRHQVPGGQFTNLRLQAEAVGLRSRWSEVIEAYREADQLLGELIKVTPSSKAVGDLALFMVQNDLTAENLVGRARELSFPESVIGLLKGRLGRPPYGFPKELQDAVLKGDTPLTDRPGAYLSPIDFESVRKDVFELTKDRPLETQSGDREVLSRILFPEVFRDYAIHRAAYGNTAALDTPTFFYGLEPGERVTVDIEPGKTLIIRLVSVGDLRTDGTRPVLFELNGHAREVRVRDLGATVHAEAKVKADPRDWTQVGASMPGKVVQVLVEPGDSVHKGAPLVIAEAMKMETAVTAPRDAVVVDVEVKQGDEIEAGELLVRLGPVPESPPAA